MKKDLDQKQKDLEENFTVADMNVAGMPGNERPEEREKIRDLKSTGLSKNERWALIKGAYLGMLPTFLIAVAAFCAIFGLIYLYFTLVRG